MMAEMIDAFDRTDADDSVRAVIVTGRGRGFCAGADLSGGGETFSRGGGGEPAGDDAVPRDGGGPVSLRIFESKKTLIAPVNGAAGGGGVARAPPMGIPLAAR